MKKRTLLLLSSILLVLSVLNFSVVQAQGQETCPEEGDWVKIDNLTGFTYTYTAPDGKLVAESCYKAATTLVWESYNPPQKQVTITSTVINPGGELAELSHVSVRLVLEEIIPTPTPTEPGPSPTPTEPGPSPTPTEPGPSPTPTQPGPTPTFVPVISDVSTGPSALHPAHLIVFGGGGLTLIGVGIVIQYLLRKGKFPFLKG